MSEKQAAADAVAGVIYECVFRLKKLTPEHLEQLQLIERNVCEYMEKLDGEA